MLLQEATTGAHPLSGSIAELVWLIPVLPFIGFLINGWLSVSKAAHVGPGDPSAAGHGDGEDGRIKSAIGIGSLLLDGLGDTIRVSLTEDSVYEIPVARAICAMRVIKSSASPGAKIIRSANSSMTKIIYGFFSILGRRLSTDSRFSMEVFGKR